MRLAKSGTSPTYRREKYDITPNKLGLLPVVVHAFYLAVEEGKEAAVAYINKVNTNGSTPHGGDGNQ